MSQENELKCPDWGSRKLWKDRHLNIPSGRVQRYLCRDCGARDEKVNSIDYQKLVMSGKLLHCSSAKIVGNRFNG